MVCKRLLLGFVTEIEMFELSFTCLHWIIYEFWFIKTTYVKLMCAVNMTHSLLSRVGTRDGNKNEIVEVKNGFA